MSLVRNLAVLGITGLFVSLVAAAPKAVQASDDEALVQKAEELWKEVRHRVGMCDGELVQKGLGGYDKLLVEISRLRAKLQDPGHLKRLDRLQKEMDENEHLMMKLLGRYVDEAKRLLVKMKLAEDEKSFDEVIRLHLKGLVPLAGRMVATDEDFKDISQEILKKGKAFFANARLLGGRLPDSGIRITKQERSAPFPDARLKIVSPKEGETLSDRNVSVTLDLSGFETGVQTEGAAEKGIASSPKGQHVHIIIDNGPYKACYDATKPFPIGELEPGTHVIRAFPSRSYHESVKTEGAFAMVTFHVEKATTAPIEAGAPLLTYSRPKGEYEGEGAKKIMVDFYLSNVTLSEEGTQVRLSIQDSQGTEVFMRLFTEWTPYYVEGLGEGEHTFNLKLVDTKDNVVPGAYNSTERTIRVEVDDENN